MDPRIDLEKDDALVEQAKLLVSRLERLSADSIWAHRASGFRGSLIRRIDRVESGSGDPSDGEYLENLVIHGFELLENAAKEMIR